MASLVIVGSASSGLFSTTNALACTWHVRAKYLQGRVAPPPEHLYFSNIQHVHESLSSSKNLMIIRIKDNKRGEIIQTPMSINRCCKPFKVEPDISNKKYINDVIPRVSCNMGKDPFLTEYVQKRKAVILLGCQKDWPARKWTFEGIFQLN